jgi:hypothetical protein
MQIHFCSCSLTSLCGMHIDQMMLYYKQREIRDAYTQFQSRSYKKCIILLQFQVKTCIKVLLILLETLVKSSSLS